MHWLPLSPRKLRCLAALFLVGAVTALLTGCSAADPDGDPANGLRGLILATRPGGHIASDPATPQRHPRLPQFPAVHHHYQLTTTN